MSDVNNSDSATSPDDTNVLLYDDCGGVCPPDDYQFFDPLPLGFFPQPVDSTWYSSNPNDNPWYKFTGPIQYSDGIQPVISPALDLNIEENKDQPLENELDDCQSCDTSSDEKDIGISDVEDTSCTGDYAPVCGTSSYDNEQSTFYDMCAFEIANDNSTWTLSYEGECEVPDSSTINTGDCMNTEYDPVCAVEYGTGSSTVDTFWNTCEMNNHYSEWKLLHDGECTEDDYILGVEEVAPEEDMVEEVKKSPKKRSLINILRSFFKR